MRGMAKASEMCPFHTKGMETAQATECHSAIERQPKPLTVCDSTQATESCHAMVGIQAMPVGIQSQALEPGRPLLVRRFVTIAASLAAAHAAARTYVSRAAYAAPYVGHHRSQSCRCACGAACRSCRRLAARQPLTAEPRPAFKA